MSDQPSEKQTPPAKKTAARRPAKKAAASTKQAREKQVAVRLTQKSRGLDIGAIVEADESRAAELVESGLARYPE